LILEVEEVATIAATARAIHQSSASPTGLRSTIGARLLVVGIGGVDGVQIARASTRAE
jgi:hypothetical protein